ncbi:hypothetical protein [Hydrogenophaga sp.]|jgi:hypothetical protein|uniref:hypothetical protein n=1 Tax=Hydrogenophaga sp. TaxID=1904254 RepID=UPI00273166E1|nr:hypothetical protein [Hydrogenophaga sp.]MDP2015244.1 hypothetical protein [Hydrogenophaga sp.]
MKHTVLATIVMAAALAACHNNQEKDGSGTAGAGPTRVPNPIEMRAWRESRDGYQYIYDSFEVNDLQCRNLRREEIPKIEAQIRTDKTFDEFFDVAIKCSYRYKAERHKPYASDTRDSLNRKVTDELWYVARSEDASLRYWRGSNNLPGRPLY